VRSDDIEALEAAIESYRGPLLPDCFEEWVVEERRERVRAHAAGIRRYLGLADSTERKATALRHLELAMQTNGYDEELPRLLMRTYRELGQYAAAINTYCRLRTELHRTLKTDPAPETSALFFELRAEARAAARRARSDRIVI
jgi:DNA-binding SARP family transcriptional activator